MKLNQTQTKHIANLAKLELTEGELEKYTGQLSDVLNYIEQLREVDTTEIEPTAQVTELKNVFRKDEVKEWDVNEVKMALEQASEMEYKQVKVKRVLE